MLIKLATIFECSRIYSLPMTVLSWLVVFTYSVLIYGNALYGVIALIGICLVHLATNVLDDYFDYKSLIKQLNFNRIEYLKNTQKTKCRYIITGLMSEREVLLLALMYLFFASLIGLFFYFKCGVGVVYFALLGLLIALFYSCLSKIRLSEFVVGIAYGPALFGGVNYAMTGVFSWEAIILSVPTMIVTIILLYTHTLMDFDYDLAEGKKTIANSYNSQLDALIILKMLIIFSYIATIVLCVLDILDWQIFMVFLTIPLSMDLYKSMYDFAINPESIPEKRWFHFPMENLERIKKLGAESFMIRIYQSRNLMIYFSILLTIGIILSLI